MKRLTLIILALLLALSMTACGKSNTVAATEATTSTATWQEKYDLGVHFLTDGNYEEAIIAFTAAIGIDPKRADAYIGRGDSYVQLNEQLDLAQSDYEKAIELEANSDAYLGLAKIYIQRGDSDRAVETIRNGLEKNENNTVLANLLASLETIVPETEPTQASQIIKNGLSDEFFGQLPIRNLGHELTDGELFDNDTEGFIGYTNIHFDFDLSGLDENLAQGIKDCLIWAWKENPFSYEEAVQACVDGTSVWGDFDLKDRTPITECGGCAFPTYEYDRGKNLQVCLVLLDSNSKAIGYCLADVTVPTN